MKKIKIFEDIREADLEKRVNQFLAEHSIWVTDIQFVSMPRNYCPCYAVAVVYEDYEDGDSN